MFSAVGHVPCVTCAEDCVGTFGPVVIFDSCPAKRVKSSLVSTLNESSANDQRIRTTRRREGNVRLARGSTKRDHPIPVARREITKRDPAAKHVRRRPGIKRSDFLP